MQSAQKEFEEHGVGIVVVSFAKPERLSHCQRVQAWPFTLLADPQCGAYSRFGFQRLAWYRLFSWATVKVYARLLLRGRRIEFYGWDDYFQSGGDLLIDRDGRLHFVYHSCDPVDRPGVSQLLEEVRKAKSEIEER